MHYGCTSFQAGTDYDTKEEIFRNYPGFVGSDSTDITLRYTLTDGVVGNLTLSCMDPSGKIVFRLKKSVGPSKTSGAYTIEPSTGELRTGIWNVKVYSDGQEIAEMEFPVVPLEVNEEPDRVRHGDQSLLAQIDKLTYQFWKADGLCSVEDLGLECSFIDICSKTKWSSMSPDPKSDNHN